MTHFIIMRASGQNFATRGPEATALPLEEAKAELKALKMKYPAQDFVLFKEHSRAHVSHRVTVRAVEELQSKRRKALPTADNVVTINPKAKAVE